MASAPKPRGPALSLAQAVDKTMELIDGADCDIAIFLVDGALISCKKRSQEYKNNLRKMAPHLVGVYNLASDARQVRADLDECYRMPA